MRARPADEDHPYGHGRFETLTGLLIGPGLTAGGALISYLPFPPNGQPRPRIASLVVRALQISMTVQTWLASIKFRYGRRLASAALTADAWNDAIDTFSAIAALVAVGLTLSDPVRFGEADRYGGCVVGLIVVLAGLRVSRETSLQL